MDIYITFMSFFVKGGIFMAPIALVGALALAIAVERYITLTRLVVTNRRVWDDVEPVLSNADFDAARGDISSVGVDVGRTRLTLPEHKAANSLRGSPLLS